MSSNKVSVSQMDSLQEEYKAQVHKVNNLLLRVTSLDVVKSEALKLLPPKAKIVYGDSDSVIYSLDTEESLNATEEGMNIWWDLKRSY